MGEWQPIETAPRDGSSVLLFGEQEPHFAIGAQGSFVFSGYWDMMDEAWCSTASLWNGPFYKPTHWTPLPSSPAL